MVVSRGVGARSMKSEVGVKTEDILPRRVTVIESPTVNPNLLYLVRPGKSTMDEAFTSRLWTILVGDR